MTEHKRYQISKIYDILEVPEDRLDALFADMREWYTYAKQIQFVESENVTFGKTFTWVDDGIDGVTHSAIAFPSGTVIKMEPGQEIEVGEALSKLVDSIVLEVVKTAVDRYKTEGEE